jgi:hypothetical protein
MIGFPTEKFRAQIHDRHVPVEEVPTPDMNIDISRYFQKWSILSRKNPCNLAAFLLLRKWKRLIDPAEQREGQKRTYRTK